MTKRTIVPTQTPDTLSRRVLGAFAAPSFSQAFIHGPALSVLQGIYGKFYGLGLEQIALVILISRIFDAVTDPIIGFLSDGYRARRGSRKPWLISGSLLSVVACWFLYVPVGEVTTWSFLFWYLLASLGWTIAEVPYGAWLAELTEDYAERARVATWRSVARYLGLMAFFSLPIVAQRYLGSTEFTPDVLRLASIFAAVVLISAALLASVVVPNGIAPSNPKGTPLGAAFKAVIRNRPLLHFTAMFACSGLGAGIAWGLIFFFIDGHLGLGEQFAGLLVLSVPISVVATPLWGWLCQRFGKQQAWAVGCAGTVFVSLAYALVPQGEGAFVAMVVLLLLFNSLIVVEAVAGPAMLADVVDYGRWRFGADHAGTYFAFYAMVQKINIGIGSAIGLWVAGVFGYDPTLAEQTARGTFGLLLAVAVLPALFYVGASLLIWFFPITRRRQETILRALARRAERRSSHDAEPAAREVVA